MSDLRDLRTVIGAVRASPKPVPLVCPCGGAVVLGGEPAPTYTCAGCSTVRHSLADLVPKGARDAE